MLRTYIALTAVFIFTPAFGLSANCPGGDRNDQENVQVLGNLEKHAGIQVQRRADWLPPCCKSDLRLTSACTEKAQKFLDATKAIGNGIKESKVTSKIMDGEHVKTGAFWDQLCDPDRNGAGINAGVQRTYSNGIITVHDQAIPKDPAQYEKEMKAMALLLDSPNTGDPITKDRMEMFSVLYYERVALGWAYSGYHFCVGRFSGTTFESRDLGLTGAHTQGLNKSNIGVCLLGNTEQRVAGVNYDEKYKLPAKQTQVAARLIDGLSHQFQIDKGRHVVTHNHLQCKDCCLLCNAWLRDMTGNPELTTAQRLVSVDPEHKNFAGESQRRLDHFKAIGEHRSECLSPAFTPASLTYPTKAAGQVN